MKPTRKPELMTPDDRLREVASIIAQGVLRLRRMPNLGLSAMAPQSSPQSHNCLEVSPESRLHVADGSAG